MMYGNQTRTSQSQCGFKSRATKLTKLELCHLDLSPTETG